MTFKRSFTDASWWNTPIPAATPVDPYSDRYKANLRATESSDKISVGVGAWRMFFNDADHTGNLVTITAKDGRKVQIHAPAKVDLMAGNDKACVFRCLGCDLEVSLFEAVQADATHWRCTNFGAYKPSSTGIAGTPGNDGHRGIPPSAMMITGQEIADGVINHRLKFAVASPADKRLDGKGMPIWPLNGFEKGHGSALPEGAVLRLKQSALQRVNPKGTALTIARAFAVFGGVCGETGGHATVKTQLNAVLPADTGKALNAFTFADYDVMLLGFGKS